MRLNVGLSRGFSKRDLKMIPNYTTLLGKVKTFIKSNWKFRNKGIVSKFNVIVLISFRCGWCFVTMETQGEELFMHI